MKQSWWLEITLKSDLCTATGNGIEGMVDIETAQEYGFPVIPAKRIKGCLLDAGKELADHGLIQLEDLYQLFGRPGDNTGSILHVESGHLYQVPGQFLEENDTLLTLENYTSTLNEIESEGEFLSQEIFEIFTRLRTRTAMDKNGVAKSGSLRTMRVVRKGIRFRARLEIEGYKKEEKLVQVLEWCVKGTRHMGIGVTRGFGEVTCSLSPIIESISNIPAFQILGDLGKNDNVRIDFTIELLEPVLLAGKKGLYEDCEDWITGSSIRGAAASMFINERKLLGNLHKDEDFNRIFLREGVTFGYGFLKKHSRIFYPCPASIVRSKSIGNHTEKGICFDLLVDKDTSKRTKDIHGLVSFSQEGICIESPKKEMRMHHARPADRGIGHALGDRGGDSKDMGQFYQYVSLVKGQKFLSSWQGKQEDIQMLIKCLEKREGKLRIGRSRTAEYGTIRLIPKGITKLETSISDNETSDHWIIHLLTPMVLFNKTTLRAEANPDLLIQEWNQEGMIGAQLKNVFLKFTRIGGYNGRWLLPESQHPALAAGTVLEVGTKKPISRFWFENQRFGKMTGLGLGMVRAVSYDSNRNQFPVLELSPQKIRKETQSPFVEKLMLYRERNKSKQNDQIDVLKIQAVNVLHTTAIEYLISILKLTGSDPYSHIIEEITKIKDKKKYNDMLEFLKPCKNKSKEFIATYLEKEKWRARNGER